MTTPVVSRAAVRDRTGPDAPRDLGPAVPEPVVAPLLGIDSSIPARLAALDAEIDRLKRQQREQRARAIAILIGPGVAFSAGELWRHRLVSAALADALTQLGVTGPRSLGRRLQQLHDVVVPGVRIARVAEDHDGILWSVDG